MALQPLLLLLLGEEVRSAILEGPSSRGGGRSISPMLRALEEAPWCHVSHGRHGV